MTKKPKDVETLSVRVWPGQLELVDKAAAILGMDRADYTRFRFIPIAAKDAGVDPMPQFPPFGSPGRPGKVAPEVAHAAKLVGMSPKEFVDSTALTTAREIIRASSAPPPAPSHVEGVKTGPAILEREPDARPKRRKAG